jgi:hypothetical protein
MGGSAREGGDSRLMGAGGSDSHGESSSQEDIDGRKRARGRDSRLMGREPGERHNGQEPLRLMAEECSGSPDHPFASIVPTALPVLLWPASDLLMIYEKIETGAAFEDLLIC